MIRIFVFETTDIWVSNVFVFHPMWYVCGDTCLYFVNIWVCVPTVFVIYSVCDMWLAWKLVFYKYSKLDELPIICIISENISIQSWFEICYSWQSKQKDCAEKKANSMLLLKQENIMIIYLPHQQICHTRWHNDICLIDMLMESHKW